MSEETLFTAAPPLTVIRVVDFEATGMPPDAALCEVGYCDVLIEATGTRVLPPRSMLVNPGRPIPPEAQAVHHISDEEVAGAPDVTVGLRFLTAGEPDYYAAHNCEYEQHFFTGGDKEWICTRKAALKLWPDAPSHKNQVLRYWLRLPVNEAGMPHRAGPDTHVTAHILVAALERAPIQDLVLWTKQPAILTKVMFGKHRGARWEEVPTDYLDWIMGQKDMDKEVKHTAKCQLALRAAAREAANAGRQ